VLIAPPTCFYAMLWKRQCRPYIVWDNIGPAPSGVAGGPCGPPPLFGAWRSAKQGYVKELRKRTKDIKQRGELYQKWLMIVLTMIKERNV
jgi:hypothetical protein